MVEQHVVEQHVMEHHVIKMEEEEEEEKSMSDPALPYLGRGPGLDPTESSNENSASDPEVFSAILFRLPDPDSNYFFLHLDPKLLLVPDLTIGL